MAAHRKTFLERVRVTSEWDLDDEKSWYVRTRHSRLIIPKGDCISFLMLHNNPVIIS